MYNASVPADHELQGDHCGGVVAGQAGRVLQGAQQANCNYQYQWQNSVAEFEVGAISSSSALTGGISGCIPTTSSGAYDWGSVSCAGMGRCRTVRTGRKRRVQSSFPGTPDRIPLQHMTANAYLLFKNMFNECWNAIVVYYLCECIKKYIINWIYRTCQHARVRLPWLVLGRALAAKYEKVCNWMKLISHARNRQQCTTYVIILYRT